MGNRRQRFTGRSGLAVISVLALGVVAACSDEGSGGGDEPRAVDRLVFAVPAPTQEAMNPNRDMQPQDEFQLKPMYENLIGADPQTGAWIPMLAESWELEQDDQLRFILREGVQFHNDLGEFTAADVEYSYQDLIEPAGAVSGVAEAVRTTVDRLEIVNDYEIVFHLNETSYSFFEGLGYGAAGMAIKSSADAEARGSAGLELDDEPIAGTGPYQFVERTPGENVVFEGVPYEHWRQQPPFEELEYRFINENATRLSALLAGEVHVTQLPTELLPQAESDGARIVDAKIPGRRIGMSLLGCYYAEPPSVDELSADVFVSGDRKFPDSPMCDIDVRKAINKAIDRDALNQAFYGGEAEQMFQWYWQPELPGFNPEWEEQWDELYGYDPDASRALLEEAGYGEGELEVQVLAIPNSGGAESADVSEAVAGMLQDVGIDAPIVTMDPAKAASQREAREFESAIEFDSTSSEPVTGFEPQGYANQDSGRAVEMVELDTPYEQVLLELDPDEQAELWGAFGNQVFEAVQHVPLLRIREQMVIDPAVVEDYVFPGAMMSAPYSFVEYITPTVASEE